MRTIFVRTILIGAMAWLTFATPAAAQAPQPSAILNSLAVGEFVARAEPADHARLNAHFAALADRYTAEAKRHTVMAQSFGGNPNRRLATDSGAHCTRLAKLATESAATLRELATFHEQLAAGAPAIAPRDAARFQAGEGAPAPTEQELSDLAAKARTPADHRALDEYFATLAKDYTARAEDHVAMARAYRSNPSRRGGDPAVHCDRLVTTFREAAKEARAAAETHRQLANIG